MQYKKLGNLDRNVSIVSLGTMTFGEQNSEEESHRIMDYAYEKGINFFDTAEMYPVYPKQETSGNSERIIGKWLKEKNNRKKVIIGTKIASNNPSGIGATKLHWIRDGGINLTYDKKNISRAIDASLKRLKTDYIDLFQLHWPERNIGMFGKLDFEYDPLDKWTPIEEVLENLNDYIKLGKIRAIGVSNESPWGIMKFIQLSKEKNLPRIVSTQNAYNLLNRVFDISNSEVSIRENCGLLAYSPIAGGRLTGKYIDNLRPINSRYTLWPGRFSRHLTDRGERAVKKYVDIAKKYNFLPSALAHAFVINRPFLTSSIMGVTSVKNLKENLSCLDIKLTNEILNEIEDIHLSDPNPCV